MTSPAIRRMEGLNVRPKSKRIHRQGTSSGLPTQANHRHHVWTWDFIFDRTEKGSVIKILTMLDEFARQQLRIYRRKNPAMGQGESD
jgi:putative transposase